jgi:hypothetical protein
MKQMNAKCSVIPVNQPHYVLKDLLTAMSSIFVLAMLFFLTALAERRQCSWRDTGGSKHILRFYASTAIRSAENYKNSDLRAENLFKELSKTTRDAIHPACPLWMICGWLLRCTAYCRSCPCHSSGVSRWLLKAQAMLQFQGSLDAVWGE